MLVSARWGNTSRSQRYQSRFSTNPIPATLRLVISRWRDWSGNLVVARLQLSAENFHIWARHIQSVSSLEPAPPSGYIHLLSGIPISFAYSVEVRTHDPAKLMLLNAFIKSGSRPSAGSSEIGQVKRHTWKANHPIFLRNSPNILFCRGWLAIIPSKRISLRDFRKIRIQLSRLSIIILNRLSSMSSECILIKWIDMNR